MYRSKLTKAGLFPTILTAAGCAILPPPATVEPPSVCEIALAFGEQLQADLHARRAHADSAQLNVLRGREYVTAAQNSTSPNYQRLFLERAEQKVNQAQKHVDIATLLKVNIDMLTPLASESMRTCEEQLRQSYRR